MASVSVHSKGATPRVSAGAFQGFVSVQVETSREGIQDAMRDEVTFFLRDVPMARDFAKAIIASVDPMEIGRFGGTVEEVVTPDHIMGFIEHMEANIELIVAERHKVSAELMELHPFGGQDRQQERRNMLYYLDGRIDGIREAMLVYQQHIDPKS